MPGAQLTSAMYTECKQQNIHYGTQKNSFGLRHHKHKSDAPHSIIGPRPFKSFLDFSTSKFFQGFSISCSSLLHRSFIVIGIDIDTNKIRKPQTHPETHHVATFDSLAVFTITLRRFTASAVGACSASTSRNVGIRNSHFDK